MLISFSPRNYDEGTLFYGILPQNPFSESKHEKTSDKPKLRDILQNTWPLLFLKSVKVTKDKEELKNSQSREDKRDMTATCSVETWIGSWDRIRTSAKKHKKQIVCSSVNNTVHKHPMGCKMVTTVGI